MLKSAIIFFKSSFQLSVQSNQAIKFLFYYGLGLAELTTIVNKSKFALVLV